MLPQSFLRFYGQLLARAHGGELKFVRISCGDRAAAPHDRIAALDVIAR
jgi:hypothetical protein